MDWMPDLQTKETRLEESSTSDAEIPVQLIAHLLILPTIPRKEVKKWALMVLVMFHTNSLVFYFAL